MTISPAMRDALKALDLHGSANLPFQGFYKRTFQSLLARGLVRRNKYGCYSITRAGKAAIADQ